MLENRTLFTYDEYYYDYVPERLAWHSSGRLCNQRTGALAIVYNAFENRELTNFLTSLNRTQPVWIARKVMTHLKSSIETLILEFRGRSDKKNARLLHTFPSMGSVTVCARLRFDPSCFGFSTVFSYSIKSFINEFQLRGRLVQGQPVQLALLVHGTHGPYQEAFLHDGSWHSVCVGWSRHGGRWALYADGSLINRGDGLNVGRDIGPEGLFIIGQEQDTFGGSFRSVESFSGSISQLNVWERALNDSEIHAMEKECLFNSPGLVFNWSKAALEIESSLKSVWGDTPCQVNNSESAGHFLDTLRNAGLEPYHNFSDEAVNAPKIGQCVTFDPQSGSWGLDACDSLRGAVCQFEKESLDIFGFPKTAFFTKVSKDLLSMSVTGEISVNASSEAELSLMNHLTRALLRMLEAEPDILQAADVLYLTQMMELTASATTASVLAFTLPPSEAVVSIASNYLKLASLVLEPAVASRWLGLTEDGTAVGPFTVVESIDKLTAALADVLSLERQSFTLSMKNIDVHIEARKLSQMSCSCVFKPPVYGSGPGRGSSQDELLIPDIEVQRLHSLGYKELMFIHTYYSHLMEIQSGMEGSKHDKSDPSSRLTSAVISASVRDTSKAHTIPVAVQYTLSSSHVVEYTPRVMPVCAFWNFSLMTGYPNGWSIEGCVVTYAGSDTTSCLCNHTTNFAVLMNYMEAKWSPEEEVILTKLTFIGSGASLCALVVTLMLFTVLDIPKSDRTSIHKNLFISLTCAQVVLLCSGSAVNDKVACTLVAALLHLFFMASFSWMLVEGLLLWSKVVTVNLSEDRHMKYYYFIGWGLPVLIVTITLASASGKYSADGHCWLSVQNGVIWGFAGPVIFIIMVNIMVLTRVVVITLSTAKRRSIMLALGSSPVEQAYEQIRAAVKAVLVLLPILGLTWLCGVLVPFSIVMGYIFILLNSLQGLFIFLIYGVYNTEVRSTVNRIKERRKALNLSNCASSRPSSSVTSTRPTSSPVPGPPSPHSPGLEEKKEEGPLPGQQPTLCPTDPHICELAEREGSSDNGEYVCSCVHRSTSSSMCSRETGGVFGPSFSQRPNPDQVGWSAPLPGKWTP
ncbi:adhesion G-protein coupled receptor D2 isoform X1 [Osmerus eperlanus]|uniref:adhesion G-protein coupled receptor D2 isoform X1 n=1 Tax=Osmerus eperlanus TaxID=29151 RepID=UPI002E104DB5